MKRIVVATERTDAYQAMYVDGVLRSQEETMYFTCIMEWVKDDEPVILSQIDVDLPEYADWPETLEKLNELQARLAELEAAE